MKATRRELRDSTGIIAIQITLLVALAAGSWWYGLLTLRAASGVEQAAYAEMHRVQATLSHLTRSVQDFGASSESWETGAILDELKRACSAVEKAVREHGTSEQIAETETAMTRLAASAADVIAAATPAARVAASRRLADMSEFVAQHLRSVEVTVLQGAGAQRERCIRVLLAACAGILAVYAATAMWLRGALLSAYARRSASIRASASALADELRAAVYDAPAPAPRSEATSPVLAPLSAAIQCAREELDRARSTLGAERQRARFSHELVEALELADGEPDVCATTAAAAQVAFGSASFQLLLADNSHARLTPQLAAGPAPCTPDSPHLCPALRRSRTLVHRPDGGIARCPRLEKSEQTVACAAISVRGRSVGVAQLAAANVSAPECETLTAMSFSIGARLGVVRTLGERELAAATDVLTGLANRRAMAERLATLDERGTPYAVISADLDHFKTLNDTYGHEVGDRCLRVFAQVLRDASRSDDMACRPGGEEFALVLTRTDAAGATAVAERIHSLLADATRRSALPFTVSLGVAARPSDGDSAEDVLRAADAALYSAKASGRNCTRLFAVGTTHLASVG